MGKKLGFSVSGAPLKLSHGSQLDLQMPCLFHSIAALLKVAMFVRLPDSIDADSPPFSLDLRRTALGVDRPTPAALPQWKETEPTIDASSPRALAMRIVHIRWSGAHYPNIRAPYWISRGVAVIAWLAFPRRQGEVPWEANCAQGPVMAVGALHHRTK